MNNLDLMKLRAQHANNDRQRDRMVADKLKSLHRALLYSYQTAWIKKDGIEDAEYIRALINPDKVKFDYDEKIVSIDFIHNFHLGDTFEWKGTNTHWIILKQELTEVAYFRANVRRCQALEVTDADGNSRTIYAAIRGPVETKINTIQKAGIVADVPNASLQIYMPRTTENLELFVRYFTFEFQGKFWKVQQTDDISTPGILEIVVLEDYDCNHSELLIEVVDPNVTEDGEIINFEIIGPTFIQPLCPTEYYVENLPEGQWSVAPVGENKDIKDSVKIVQNEKGIKLTWTAMISGSFILKCDSYEKTIVVESLF